MREIFEQWKEDNEEARKKMFTDFMHKNVNLNKVDESMIVIEIVAPPAAMVAKATGQTAFPQPNKTTSDHLQQDIPKSASDSDAHEHTC